MIKSRPLPVLLLILLPAAAGAETLVQYDSVNEDYQLRLQASDWADGINTPSLFQFSPSVTRLGGKTVLSSVGWDTTINPAKYMGFTLSAKPGYRLCVDVLRNFTTGGGRQTANAMSSFVWAYRIDDNNDGVFEKDWTFGKTYLPSDGEEFFKEGGTAMKNWYLPNNVSTKGTIQFGVFGTTANAGGTLHAFSGTLRLEGASVPIGTLGAMRFEGSHDIAVSEASAVAWSRDTDTLFSIGDEGLEMTELSKTGVKLGFMPFEQSGKRETRALDDPEGLCWLGGNRFVIADERRNLAVVVNYDPATKPDLAQVTPTSYPFGPYDSNTGLEGVTYDPINDSLWGVRESGPVEIYEMPGFTPVSQGGPVAVNQPLETRRIARSGVDQLSDIYAMALSRRFPEGNPRHSNFLMLARGRQRVIEVDRQGRVVGSLDLRFLGRLTTEGMTMDDAGNLYLVSEQVPGSFNAQLHVFSPAAAEPVWPATQVRNYGFLKDALVKAGAVPELAFQNADLNTALDAVAADGKADVLAHPGLYDLYTEDSIQDLRGTGVLLKVGEDGVNLRLPIQRSTTLGEGSWEDAGEMETTLPKQGDKAFYRLTLPQ
ncbi:SdiA-regulated domain-containing protein [Luteolibacter yonseiensis]|uniref:SdiA-regulated domain-containing protein n=1 Tax=Luteolibacter yonseiensis TaxID=1144680 RepID=A0A934R2W2_9BACT|nr:SdiA-regulated domain-containing protein [Luteolibacter yonseiensis]MBK1815817.1 SdiA-regulated domain-containing protein [Luteolibacter yonseiensis]